MTKSEDIYDHLAEVYLNSSRNKKKNFTHHKSIFNNLFKRSIIVAVCFIIVLAVTFFRNKSIPKSQKVLILEANTTKIDYDFNKIKKEAAIFDLKDMNLLGFKALSFRARKSNFRDDLHMSVEFVSDFGEKSQIYIKQIPNRWKNFKIDLTEFKNISDWSHMRQLLFVLEEWNAQTKKGIVYFDNVYVLK